MLISPNSLSKFGDMNSGSGSAGMHDGNSATVGYAQSTTGYSGVTLAAPARIQRVELVSADNGFDASGSITSITLQLYGRVGAPPSSGTDGQILCAMAFTDQNVSRVVELVSSDQVTRFDHIWIRMTTGVWSLASELRIFDAEDQSEITDPEVIGPGMCVLSRSCNDKVPLYNDGFEIPQFRIRIALCEPRRVAVDFHGCVVHTGTGADDVAVGYSFRICHRNASSVSALASAQFIERPNAADGGNVFNHTHHYGSVSIPDAIELPEGFNEISVIGSGHTDGSSTQGLLHMLVEAGKGLNCLRVIVMP